MTDTGNPARIFGGRYEIKHKIARGGMADVFYARDNLLDRPVALKVLFPELSIDPSFVERFRREAQNAARLSHPNIVSVYDWGEDASTYYIVMELVEGQSLSTLLREQKRLPVDRAAAIGAEVASALSFAHRNGVVHRDVKPGNVLIDARGAVKVTDFGIARARNTTENLTQTGAVMGTATYFSPEQAQGLSVDQRSDVYSLGVVLYEMVAGKPPFAGDNPVTIAYKHVRETPPSLPSIDPSIPKDFQAIVAQALTKAPANRYATADDLRSDLERFRHGQPVTATGVAPPPDATQAIPTTAYRSPQQAYADGTSVIPTAQPERRASVAAKRKVAGPLAMFAALLLAIVIGSAIFLNGGFGGPTETVPVQVPDVVGQSANEAREVLEDSNLRVSVTRQTNTAPRDQVFRQDPSANVTARSGQVVTIFVSSGPGEQDVPGVVGRTEQQARAMLTTAGFKVDVTRAVDTSVREGEVINQSPSAGTSLARGETVTITVSERSPATEVPDLEGFTESAAQRALSDLGLQSNIRREPSRESAGTVLRTEPDAGASLQRGSTVTIIVSSGAPTTTTSTTTSTSTSTSTTTTPDD